MKAVAIFIAVCVALCISAGWCAEAPKSPDRAYVDAVLDGLVEQGILTQGQVDAIKAKGEAAATAAAKAAPATKAPDRIVGPTTPAETAKKKAWTSTVKVGGYTQARWANYPGGLDVKDANGDPRRISNEFMVRRARLVIEARPARGTKVVLQPEFGKGEATVTDAFVEQSFGPEDSSRLRLGSQYVPVGFEVTQSSSSVLPLELDWAATRAIPGSRDTGLTYYYTTAEDRKLFDMAKARHYAPGDYGNFAVSFFNGQGLGKEAMEVNSNKHVAVSARKALSLGKGDEYAEVGAGYYAGTYLSKAAKREFDEDFLNLHGYVAPTPFGVQAEYWTGETEGHDLDGWYVMGLWRPEPRHGTVFVRHDDFNGWRKGSNKADDRHRWSVGYAWEMNEASRITVEYDRDVMDTAAGGDADVVGVQWMVRY